MVAFAGRSSVQVGDSDVAELNVACGEAGEVWVHSLRRETLLVTLLEDH